MPALTSKGQVTIPKRMRDAAGLKPGSAVAFELSADGRVLVGPQKKAGKSDYAKRIEKVRGTLKLGMSTDDFMALLRGD